MSVTEDIEVQGNRSTLDLKILFAVPLNLQEYTVDVEGPIVNTNTLHKLICVGNLDLATIEEDSMQKSTDGIPLKYKYVPVKDCHNVVDFEADEQFVSIPAVFKATADTSEQPSGFYDPTGFQHAEVARVVDGDTIYVTLDDHSELKVRLLGIDTPESVSSNPYENTIAGKIASDYTKKLLPVHTDVWLQRDHENVAPLIDDTDAYGRALRYVWKQLPSDPTDPAIIYKYMVNAILLAKGYATPFRVAPNIRYARIFSDGPPVDEDAIPYIDGEDSAGVMRVNCGPADGVMIHDSLAAFKLYPYVPSAILNNSLYMFGTNNLLHLYMRHSNDNTFPDCAAQVVTERVRPLEVDPSWAVMYGYNMYKGAPYDFVNIKGSTWELFGCLPYQKGTNDIRMNYKPNEEVDLVLCYQSCASAMPDPSKLSGMLRGFSDLKVYLDLSYKIVSDMTYTSLYRALPGEVYPLTAGTTEVIRIPFNIPNEDFMVRASLRYYAWAADIERKAMYYSAAVALYNAAVVDGNTSTLESFYDSVATQGATRPLISKFAENGVTIDSVDPYYPLEGPSQMTAQAYATGVENGTIIEGVYICTQHHTKVTTDATLADGLINVLAAWDPHIMKVADPEKFEWFKKYAFFSENILKEAVYSFSGGKSMMKDYGSTRGVLLEKYNLATAVGIIAWKQRLVLWGVKNAPDLVFTSDISLPSYFPFPNGVIQYPKPVIHVISFLDSILVFTQDAIYRTSLADNGISVNTETVALNVHFTQFDIPSIVVVKNMVFYKADNYYYMLVPSSKILTMGELKVAPVSRPINYFLDHFDTELRLILKDMYSSVFDYADITDPAVFDVIPDYYDVHAVGGTVKMFYYFTIGTRVSRTRIAFVLKYDTVLRTWTVDLIEMPTGQLFLYNNNVATGPEYLALHSIGAADTAALSLLSEDYDENTDLFDVYDKLLGTAQYLDTGFRELGSSWKKRFRELQIKLNNKSGVPLTFVTGFAVDNVQRTSLSGYNLVDSQELPIFTPVEAYGAAALAPDVAAPSVNNVRTWALNEQNTYPGGYDTLRWRVSGKGYCPRLRILSMNEKSFEILGNTWVYRKLNAR